MVPVHTSENRSCGGRKLTWEISFSFLRSEFLANDTPKYSYGSILFLVDGLKIGIEHHKLLFFSGEDSSLVPKC